MLEIPESEMENPSAEYNTNLRLPTCKYRIYQNEQQIRKYVITFSYLQHYICC